MESGSEGGPIMPCGLALVTENLPPKRHMSLPLAGLQARGGDGRGWEGPSGRARGRRSLLHPPGS